MEQADVLHESQLEIPAGFVEKEVELQYFDNYTTESTDRKYLAGCQRIHYCSCNCNRCGFVVIS